MVEIVPLVSDANVKLVVVVEATDHWPSSAMMLVAVGSRSILITSLTTRP